MSDLNKMFELASVARENAYAPYSGMFVGACLATEKGDYYPGCNVENTSYPLGQCAEATAIGNMFCAKGEQKISAVMIVTKTTKPIFPCGGCLQKLCEFVTPETVVYTRTLSGHEASAKFSELLPTAYGKDELFSIED